MKINKFRLVWYSDIHEQVIIWWSKILVDIEIDNYDWTEIILNISNYSRVWYITIKEGYLSKIINVDFLWVNWLYCWKNNLDSRVSININDKIYYSNPIWDYIYNENFLLEISSFYEKWDHHLWVYNKFINDYKKEVLCINEYVKYSNDIIFINRWRKFINRFIDINDNINSIIKKYLFNFKNKEVSIFYVDIFKTKISEDILYNVSKIISLAVKWSYYIYNINYSYLKEYNFDKDYYLYNYHFLPVYK